MSSVSYSSDEEDGLGLKDISALHHERAYWEQWTRESESVWDDNIEEAMARGEVLLQELWMKTGEAVRVRAENAELRSALRAARAELVRLRVWA
jgi:hypothetical protein